MYRCTVLLCGLRSRGGKLDIRRCPRERYVPSKTALNHTHYGCIGGENSQNISEAGQEADLDVQYAFGLTYPTPGTFWSVGGSPPFNPDTITPENLNEPYADVSVGISPLVRWY